jgi:hypothetical protein
MTKHLFIPSSYVFHSEGFKMGVLVKPQKSSLKCKGNGLMKKVEEEK